MVVLAPSISGTLGSTGTRLTNLNGAGHGPGDDGPQGIRPLEHHRLGILLLRHGAAWERGRGEGRGSVGGGRRQGGAVVRLACFRRANFWGESMAAMPDASSPNARAAGPSGRAVTKAEFELGGGSHLTVCALYLLLISARVCPFPAPPTPIVPAHHRGPMPTAAHSPQV